MNFFSDNLSVLRLRFPVLARRLEASPPAQGLSVEDGILRIQGDLFPYGDSAPAELVQHWLRRNGPLIDGFNFVTGFGDGTHVEGALQKLAPSGYLFVIEARLDELRTVFENRDLRPLLKHPRLLLSGGSIDQECFEPLIHVIYEGECAWRYLPYTPFQHRDPSYYAEARDRFGKELFLRKNVHSNRSDHAEDFHGTRIYNLPLTLQSPDISVLKDAFSDVPFVLVAAGPSLDESYPFLRAIQERALIVSGNSSHQALLRNGVIPHLTVAVDFREDTDKGYRETDNSNTFLACSGYVCPPILERFQGRTLAWASAGDPLDVARRRLGMPKGAEVTGEGTLTTSMLQLATLFGCRKICIVGQDLGYPATGQTHVRDSFYGDENRNSVEVSTLDKVPANRGGFAYQDAHMRLYMRAVSNRIESLVDTEVINVSVLGAQIRHTRFLEFDAALDWIGDEMPASPLSERIAQKVAGFQHGNDPADLFKLSQEPVVRYAEAVLKRALSLALRIDGMPEHFAKPHYAKHREVRECLAEADQLNALITRHPQEHGIIAEGRARPLLLEFSSLTGKRLHEQFHWDALQKNKEFAWALAEGAFFVLDCVERARQRLDKRHRDSST